MDKLVILVILIAVGLSQEAQAPYQMPILGEAAPSDVNKDGKWEMKVPDADPETTSQQSGPPPSNPFQQRAGPASKGFKGNPYDRHPKNDRARFQGRRGMKARKDLGELPRRRAQYGQAESESSQDQNWTDAVTGSNVARFSMGALLMGILVKLCLKRSHNTQKGGKKTKFSNSCYQDQVCIEDKIQPHAVSSASSGYEEQQ